jgi:hypothetical protein
VNISGHQRHRITSRTPHRLPRPGVLARPVSPNEPGGRYGLRSTTGIQRTPPATEPHEQQNPQRQTQPHLRCQGVRPPGERKPVPGDFSRPEPRIQDGLPIPTALTSLTRKRLSHDPLALRRRIPMDDLYRRAKLVSLTQVDALTPRRGRYPDSSAPVACQNSMLSVHSARTLPMNRWA